MTPGDDPGRSPSRCWSILRGVSHALIRSVITDALARWCFLGKLRQFRFEVARFRTVCHFVVSTYETRKISESSPRQCGMECLKSCNCCVRAAHSVCGMVKFEQFSSSGCGRLQGQSGPYTPEPSPRPRLAPPGLVIAARRSPMPGCVLFRSIVRDGYAANDGTRRPGSRTLTVVPRSSGLEAMIMPPSWRMKMAT
jgi:hypothetical protein